MSDFKPVVIINEYLVLQACLGFMEDLIVILPDVKKSRMPSQSERANKKACLNGKLFCQFDGRHTLATSKSTVHALSHRLH